MMPNRFQARLHRASDDAGSGHEHPGAAAAPSTSSVTDTPKRALSYRRNGATLFFDAQSGAAGDMIVGALIDLGVPWSTVQHAVASLALKGVSIDMLQENAGAIAARRLAVAIDSAAQVERTYAQIRALLDASTLSPAVERLCQRVFARLARAEAKVHGIGLADVHFHEVGAADSIVDIVAACAAIDYLGAQLVVSPLPLGRGYVSCRHGTIPLPAPATVECLIGMETYDSGLNVELVTPTAAAIIGELCTRSERWPSGRLCAVGFGKGTRVLEDRPNVLRAVLLEQEPTTLLSNPCWLLEANIDDMDGERLGHAVEQLFAAGALDAWTTAITMKKGRPAWTLSALCRPSDFAAVEASLLGETTTLGVRRIQLERTELVREVKWVKTEYGAIPIKISGGEQDGLHRIKPEFDACRKCAQQANVRVSVVIESARRSALEGQWLEHEPIELG